jgi:flagellar motor switch protein FliN
MDTQQRIAGFLDAFARTLSEALTEAGPEKIELAWSLESQESTEEWSWWSGGLAARPDANLFFGAPQETWEKLGRSGSSEDWRENASVLIGRCFAKAVEEHFAGRASAPESGTWQAPSEGTRVSIEIRYPAGQWPSAGCVLSSEFEQALSGAEPTEPARAQVSSPTVRVNSNDLLMNVQVPVSVCFGATQIRMKELLNLSSGSVVELDQALHDHVEVRVNDRVIARGEVVAVEGHYGVRVLELVSSENSLKGIGQR